MRRREWILKVLQSSLAAAAGPALFSATDDNWKPLFLTRDQNQTLISVGECIVPGSHEAKCNRIIDLLLSLESDKTQQAMLNALKAFDAHGSFAQLDSDHQAKILEQEVASNSPHFQIIKDWVADTYWSSEKGLRELGWNGRMAWESSAVCAHAPGQP